MGTRLPGCSCGTLLQTLEDTLREVLIVVVYLAQNHLGRYDAVFHS